MNKRELEELINNKKRELVAEYDKDGYDKIKELVSDSRYGELSYFIDTDIWDILKCYFFVQYEELGFDKATIIIDTIRLLIEKEGIKIKNDFLVLLSELKGKDCIDEAIKVLKSNNIFSTSKEIKTIAEKTDIFVARILHKLKKTESDNRIDLVSFLEILKSHDIFTTIVKLFVLYSIHEEMKLISENSIVVTEEKLSDKDKKRIIYKTISCKFNIDKLKKELETIKEYLLEKDRMIRSKERELKALNSALELLDKELEKKEVIKYREIAKNIKDSKLRLEILRYIEEHNLEYSRELDNELEELRKNDKRKYQSLLNEIGIRKEEYDVNSIMSNSYEEVKTIISIIKILDLSNLEIISILQNTNIEIASIIKEYMDRNILPIIYVKNNIDLFYKNSDRLMRFKESLEILNKYNLNIQLFINNIDILIDNNNLDKNLGILSKYNLLSSLNDNININFLVIDNLEERIDSLLELGYEKLLLENLDLLNSNSIKRLYVLKAINLLPTSKEELIQVLDDSKRFIIKDEELDDYIPNVGQMVKNKINTTIEELEGYLETNRVYNVGGVRISSEKVRRNIENGMDIHDSIIDKMYLSLEEYISIIEEINGNSYGKD